MHNSTPSGRQRDVGTLPLQYACRLGRLYQSTKKKFSPGRYLAGVTMWIGERKEPWGRRFCSKSPHSFRLIGAAAPKSLESDSHINLHGHWIGRLYDAVVFFNETHSQRLLSGGS